MKKVVILGGGIGGLSAALRIRERIRNCEVTVIDNSRFHVYKPFLHDLLTEKKRIEQVVIPLSGVCKMHGINFLDRKALSIAPEEGHVRLDTDKIDYDYLVTCLGGEPDFHGVKGAKTNSLTFRSVVDAAKLKDAIIDSLTKARNAEGVTRARLLTFAIIGGGVNGVELSCYLKEQVQKLMGKHGLNGSPRIILIDSDKVVLNNFPPSIRKKVSDRLSQLGIEFLAGYKVREVRKNKVLLSGIRVAKANTIIWCGGVKPNTVIKESRIELKNGGVLVNGFLQSTSHNNVFATGDSAFLVNDNFDKSFSKNAYNTLRQSDLVSGNLKAWMTDGKMKAFKPARSAGVVRMGSDHAVFHYKNLTLQGRVISKIYNIILSKRFRNP